MAISSRHSCIPRALRALALTSALTSYAGADELPTAGALTLAAVQAYAHEHNPELAAARSRAVAGHAVPPQAAAYDDPMLAAESWNSPRAVPFERAENNIIKLSQRLPFPGKLTLRGRMAEREADIADADVRRAELALHETLAAAYYDVWRTERRVQVYERDLALARELASGATARYAAGDGNQVDALRAEVQRTHAATELTTLHLERESALAQLNELIGREPENPLAHPVDPPHPHVPGPLDRLLTLAREHRPELTARAAAIRRAEDNVSLARREYLPDFELTLERFQNLDRSDGYGAMIAMTLPLAFKYRRDAALDEARARLAMEQANERREQNRTATAVKIAHATATAAATRLELLEHTHVPQAEQTFAAARVAHAAGQTDFTTLVETLRMLEATHLEHYDAEVAFERAFAALETAVGTELPREGGE